MLHLEQEQRDQSPTLAPPLHWLIWKRPNAGGMRHGFEGYEKLTERAKLKVSCYSNDLVENSRKLARLCYNKRWMICFVAVWKEI